MALDSLLPPDLERLLADERALLTDLRDALARLEPEAPRLGQIDDLVRHLDTLFLVVVVGEFNAGKSSVLNALFGETLMEEGPIPTTAKVTILRWGEHPLVRQQSEFVVERRHPAPLLKHLNLVDTPGTNSIVRRHQEITEDFVPRADLVLFITSFDRPLSESERQFLSFLRDAWGKKLVFVLNKVDLADDEAALEKVMTYLRESCQELMGFTPEVFPVSAKRAWEAKQKDWPLADTAPGFAAFERYLSDHLTGSGQLGLKLRAPLDTAATLREHASGLVAARRDVLTADEENLSVMRSRLDDARTQLRAGYQGYLAEIDNLLLKMERDGVRFLDDAIRVGQMRLLQDKDRFKEAFARQVSQGVDRQVETHITEAVDALVRQALDLWNQMMHDFAERGKAAAGQAADASFLYNRADVFRSVMRAAERKLSSYDVREEARRILENVQDAVGLVQYAGYGAAGLGVLSGVLIAATAADAVGGFGLVTAGALAVAGLTVLPRQRRRAIAAFRERVEQLRTEMRQAVTAQLENEMNRSLGQVGETIRPYADFVANERRLVADVGARLDAISTAETELRKRVDAATG